MKYINLVSISYSINDIYFPGGITFVGCSPGFLGHDEKNVNRAHRSCSEVEGVAGWWIHMFLFSPLNWGNEPRLTNMTILKIRGEALKFTIFRSIDRWIDR